MKLVRLATIAALSTTILAGGATATLPKKQEKSRPTVKSNSPQQQRKTAS